MRFCQDRPGTVNGTVTGTGDTSCHVDDNDIEYINCLQLSYMCKTECCRYASH